MDIEGIQNKHVENNNWRLNGIHYDSSYDDWLSNTPVVPSRKHDKRPHISQLTVLLQKEMSCVQLRRGQASIRLAARSSGCVAMNHLTHLWVNSHPSPCWTWIMQVCASLLLKHWLINTNILKRNDWPFAFLYNCGAFCFCLGGKHLVIVYIF